MQMDLGSAAEGGIAPGGGWHRSGRSVASLRAEGIVCVCREPGSGFYFGWDSMKACTKRPGYEGECNIHPCSVPQFPHLKMQKNI